MYINYTARHFLISEEYKILRYSVVINVWLVVEAVMVVVFYYLLLLYVLCVLIVRVFF